MNSLGPSNHQADLSNTEPCRSDIEPDSASRSRPGLRSGLGLILPAVALLLAEVAPRLGWIGANLMPPPSVVLETLVNFGLSDLLAHVGTSAARVAAGFAMGAFLALIAGSMVGLSRRLEELIDPSFQGLRSIPSLAWVPLLQLWLGIDEAPKLVLIAIGAFFPVYMGMASGLRGVDRKLVEVAKLAQLDGLSLVCRVMLPAALPAVMTGLRNGLSLAWMFMVAAELIAASSGLGYLLSDGRETSRADILFAAIGLLALLGKISDTGMGWVEARWLRWRDSFDGTPA